MTPKKAIIVVLILFLAVAILFVFLYINKNQAIKPPAGEGDNASSTSREKLSPIQEKIKDIEAKTKNQVEQIIEQGRTAAGGIAADAQGKIEDAVNREIMEKLKLKTPAEIKADEQRQAELKKIEGQVNQQIKDQLQNK